MLITQRSIVTAGVTGKADEVQAALKKLENLEDQADRGNDSAREALVIESRRLRLLASEGIANDLAVGDNRACYKLFTAETFEECNTLYEKYFPSKQERSRFIGLVAKGADARKRKRLYAEAIGALLDRKAAEADQSGWSDLEKATAEGIGWRAQVLLGIDVDDTPAVPLATRASMDAVEAALINCEAGIIEVNPQSICLHIYLCVSTFESFLTIVFRYQSGMPHLRRWHKGIKYMVAPISAA